MLVWPTALSQGTTETEFRPSWLYRALSSFRAAGAKVIDLLKSAPRWFLMIVIAGSVTFGAAMGTMCGMLALDSLARIERYAREEWQQVLAQHSSRIRTLEVESQWLKEELERRARADAEFRAEMRRNFDRLNDRLSGRR